MFVAFTAQMIVDRQRIMLIRDVLHSMPHEIAVRAVQAVDRKFMALERDLFNTQGESGKSAWAPLDPAYEKRKAAWFKQRRAVRTSQREAAKYFLARPKLSAIGQNKILQLTGGLKMSLVSPGSQHFAGYQRLKDRVDILVGTRNPLAKFHFKGGPHLKQRWPINITLEQKISLLRVAAMAIAKPLTDVMNAKLRTS